MIKVLKNGNTFYFMRCKKCGCEFIYQSQDIYREFNEVKCPECACWLHVNLKDIYNTNTNNKT